MYNVYWNPAKFDPIKFNTFAFSICYVLRQFT